MSENIMTSLVKEIERNSKLIVLYKTFPTGIYAASMIQAEVNEARNAIAEGDVVKMLAIYQTLKENEA
jgi:hypothetical protein